MTDTLIDNGYTRCPDAHHIGAFRQCPHGAGIHYRALQKPTGPEPIATVLHTAYAAGHIARWPNPNAPHVAVLDALQRRRRRHRRLPNPHPARLVVAGHNDRVPGNRI